MTDYEREKERDRRLYKEQQERNRDNARELAERQLEQQSAQAREQQIATRAASEAQMRAQWDTQSAISNMGAGLAMDNAALRAEMSSGFRDISSAFRHGFDLLGKGIVEMTERIDDRLKESIDIQNNPRRTGMLELLSNANERYRKKLYEDAIEDVNAAIDKDKTVYYAWLLRGKIYTFGESKFANVKDLGKAIESYKTAAKYNEADMAGGSKAAKTDAVEIYSLLGYVQYGRCGELATAGDLNAASAVLAGARDSFLESYKYSEGANPDALYNAARCKALLGESESALADMGKLFKRDFDYYKRSKSDADFKSINEGLDAIVTNMRDAVYAKAAPLFQQITDGYEKAKQDGIAPYFDAAAKSKLDAGISKGLDKNLPYLDMRDRYNGLFDLLKILQDAIKKATPKYEEAERKAKWEREEAEHKAKWERDEAERRAKWDSERPERVAAFEQEEAARKSKWEQEEAKRKSTKAILFVIGTLLAVGGLALCLFISQIDIDLVGLVALVGLVCIVAGLVFFIQGAKRRAIKFSSRTYQEDAFQPTIFLAKIYGVENIYKGPAGGIVFYDKGSFSDGWRYLECAPKDLGEAKWGANGKDVSGTETGIGTGKRNTELIVAFLKQKETGRAAQLCADYTLNGYSDWFLPSKDELNLMYTNLHKNKLGGFKNKVYWSSSQYNSYYAWYQFFGNGDQDGYNKSNYSYVRCVRAF